jgi:rubrerythrin
VNGHNRTGLGSSPQRHGMLDVPPDLGPTSRGSEDRIAAVRIRYARASELVGTMPHDPHARPEMLVLLDLLGARLQFERTGVRLYEALIAKYDAFGSFVGGPDRRDLVQIRDEEHAHMRMLDGLISELGGDSTVVTPAANRDATAMRGLCDVLLDPRTRLLDGLEVIVLAELADHEHWSGLIELVRERGRDDFVRIFLTAQTTEESHLSQVRAWISAGRAFSRRYYMSER